MKKKGTKGNMVFKTTGSMLLCLLLLFVLSACGKQSAEEKKETSVKTEKESESATEKESGQESAEGGVKASFQPVISSEEGQESGTEPIEADVSAAKASATPTPAKAAASAKDASPTPTKAAAAQTSAASGSTPVSAHGALSYQGTTMVDSHGAAYQLKGVSTHGIAWFPDYVNKTSFQTLRDEWGANCIRLAMYSDEYGGYCSGGNQSQLKSLVNNGVAYATELGMYVIIDWHVLGDKDPNVHKEDAKKFFDEMSKKYASYDNVLYEICNEPNGGVKWAQVKAYAEEVIPLIRANDADAIIIVGTPTWSQDVDAAAKDPITGYSNIAYTIHFYAASHKDKIRRKMQAGLDAGLPVFCSEFGTCDASGSGGNDLAEAQKWIDAMNAAGVSYCVWNLSNKAETSSLINSGCNKLYGWSEGELSEAGRWYVGVLGGKATGATQPGGSTADNSGNNNNGSNTGNNAGSTAAVQASDGNTSVTMSMANSWSDGKNNNYQYNIIVENKGNSPVSGWKLRIDFGTNVSLEQSWNGNYSMSGSSCTVTPAEFNNEIPAGGSVDVGLIVSCSGSISNPSVGLE